MNQKADSNQITRDYFDSILLESRYWNSDLPSTQMDLFGETFGTPIMTAALSHLQGVCENGMVVFAEGARDAQAVHWVGMGEDAELEDIIDTGARTVKIIKPHRDDAVVYHKIEHANNRGAFAVGMDIDHCFDGNGGYDVVVGLPMHSKTTEQLRRYVELSESPFIVKGVLSVQDAENCAKVGVKGILVSHHHGIMPYAVPPLMILPEIKRAMGGDMKIFVDCGIESGIDVFKALALGADAVCVGRDLMQALKNGGSAVTDRINQMNRELMSVMARTGARSLSQIDSSVLHFRRF